MQSNQFVESWPRTIGDSGDGSIRKQRLLLTTHLRGESTIHPSVVHCRGAWQKFRLDGLFTESSVAERRVNSGYSSRKSAHDRQGCTFGHVIRSPCRGWPSNVWSEALLQRLILTSSWATQAVLRHRVPQRRTSANNPEPPGAEAVRWARWTPAGPPAGPSAAGCGALGLVGPSKTVHSRRSRRREVSWPVPVVAPASNRVFLRGLTSYRDHNHISLSGVLCGRRRVPRPCRRHGSRANPSLHDSDKSSAYKQLYNLSPHRISPNSSQFLIIAKVNLWGAAADTIFCFQHFGERMPLATGKVHGRLATLCS